MSKYLIAYASRYGTVERAMAIIRDSLGEATTCNLKKQSCPDLNNFDWIIIGGSIYAGRIQKEVKKFCQKNLSLLRQKKSVFLSAAFMRGRKPKSNSGKPFRKNCGKQPGPGLFSAVNCHSKKLIFWRNS